MERTVRLAGPDDAAGIYDLLIALHRQSPISRYVDYDVGKIIAAIQLGTRRMGGIIGVIDGPNGNIAASVGMMLDSWWWSKAPTLFVKWLTVAPEYRHDRLDEALFEYIEATRSQLQRDSGEMILVENAHDSAIDDARLVEVKDRLYRKYGRRVGSVYLSGLPE